MFYRLWTFIEIYMSSLNFNLFLDNPVGQLDWAFVRPFVQVKARFFPRNDARAGCVSTFINRSFRSVRSRERTSLGRRRTLRKRRKSTRIHKNLQIFALPLKQSARKFCIIFWFWCGVLKRNDKMYKIVVKCLSCVCRYKDENYFSTWFNSPSNSTGWQYTAQTSRKTTSFSKYYKYCDCISGNNIIQQILQILWLYEWEQHYLANITNIVIV